MLSESRSFCACPPPFLPQALAAARSSGVGQRAADALKGALDRGTLEQRLRAAQRYGKQAHAQVRREVVKALRRVGPLRKYATPQVADALLAVVLLPGLVSVAMLPLRIVRWCLFGRRGRGGRQAQRGQQIPRVAAKESAALRAKGDGAGGYKGGKGARAAGRA